MTDGRQVDEGRNDGDRLRAALGSDELRWTVVVPLKAGPEVKSRLAGWLPPTPRVLLARAMAGDTLAAAAAARRVETIVVVTDDLATARAARRAVGAAPGRVVVHVVREPDPGGLNPAVRAGIDRARRLTPANGVAVLLGDLPALRPGDLDAALGQGSAHPLGVVLDAAGTGTTLLTAAPGVAMDPAFGPGSAAAHLARGHTRLNVAAGSGLETDVDVRADLEAVLARGPGPRTVRALRRV
ncbi:2-phospho-L-lactate guanylyltransferase [Pengzhenrongella sp.]|jgi:2-phospho-L-lactate guanylyltransferase|uniref:2-phospho-L-lactate guanylyltransferase n=1 Tax=Pengzhenrongella sp. TaxID=2888820 RepID=UPI002F950D89